jgi:hypothetical protein
LDVVQRASRHNLVPLFSASSFLAEEKGELSGCYCTGETVSTSMMGDGLVALSFAVISLRVSRRWSDCRCSSRPGNRYCPPGQSGPRAPLSIGRRATPSVIGNHDQCPNTPHLVGSLLNRYIYIERVSSLESIKQRLQLRRWGRFRPRPPIAPQHYPRVQPSPYSP